MPSSEVAPHRCRPDAFSTLRTLWRAQVFPRALARLVGLFRADVRELAEMRFQWDRPYVVDASKFGARFWRDTTSFEDELAATIAYYRKR